MTIRRWRMALATVGLAALGAPAASAVQGTTYEAWKLVPAAFPSCFADDGFDGKVIEAEQAAIAGKDRQNELNEKVKKQFDEMPMMEKAQRMQAWMMKNPDAASKMLEASANADGAMAAAEELQSAAERLDKARESNHKAFNAAVDQALKPVEAKLKAWIDAKTILVGEAQVPAFPNAADHATYVAIIGEVNATYDKACQPFYGANGVVTKWLQELKVEVTDKSLAHDARGTAMAAQQMAIMDTPSGGYRSSGQYDIVRNHLKKLYDVTMHRRPRVQAVIPLVRKQSLSDT